MLVVCSTVFFMRNSDPCFLQASCTSCITDMWELHCSYPWYNVLFHFFFFFSLLCFGSSCEVVSFPFANHYTAITPHSSIASLWGVQELWPGNAFLHFQSSRWELDLWAGYRVSSLVFCFISVLHFEWRHFKWALHKLRNKKLSFQTCFTIHC